MSKKLSEAINAIIIVLSLFQPFVFFILAFIVSLAEGLSSSGSGSANQTNSFILFAFAVTTLFGVILGITVNYRKNTPSKMLTASLLAVLLPGLLFTITVFSLPIASIDFYAVFILMALPLIYGIYTLLKLKKQLKLNRTA